MKTESTPAASTARDRWERLAALFEGALAVPVAERDDYVREHCPDPGIAEETRVLLSALNVTNPTSANARFGPRGSVWMIVRFDA